MTKPELQELAEAAYIHEPRMSESEFREYVGTRGLAETKDLADAWEMYQEFDDAEQIHREQESNYLRGLGI